MSDVLTICGVCLATFTAIYGLGYSVGWLAAVFKTTAEIE